MITISQLAIFLRLCPSVCIITYLLRIKHTNVYLTRKNTARKLREISLSQRINSRATGDSNQVYQRCLETFWELKCVNMATAAWKLEVKFRNKWEPDFCYFAPRRIYFLLQLILVQETWCTTSKLLAFDGIMPEDVWRELWVQCRHIYVTTLIIIPDCNLRHRLSELNVCLQAWANILISP